MDLKMAADSFHFVHSTDASVPKTPRVRLLIRKQAMSRAAAARRLRGKNGKQVLRQCHYPEKVSPKADNLESPSPPLGKSPGELEETLGPPQATNEAPQSTTEAPESLIEAPKFSNAAESPEREMAVIAVPASLPSTGYESMRIRYDFDLLDLSALTTFHVGRITAQALSRQPARLKDILRCRQWSFFSYLPSRYGYSACLDDAARCVTARVRDWLSLPAEGSRPSNGSILSLYTKALKSLQAALNNPDRRVEPDVLCATEILGIYELLDTSKEQAWVQHVAGATSLLKLRGPERYRTEFEKALFLSQVGPIFTEALLNNYPCFLEEDSWQTVFRAVIRENTQASTAFADHSEIVVSLWMCIVSVPSLFKETQDAICNTAPEDVDTSAIQAVLLHLYQLRKRLVQWRQRYEILLLQDSTRIHYTEEAKFDKRYESLGVCLTNLIILNRLIVALDPLMEPLIEDETQCLASQILHLEKEASIANPRSGLFMALKMVVALATLATEREWRLDARLDGESISEDDRSTGSFRPVTKWVFERWCILKGRKVVE